MKSINFIKISVILSMIFVALLVVVSVFFAQRVIARDLNTYWHVTCPQGMYNGNVRMDGFLDYVDLATGERVIIPDNCAWVEEK